jgi:hypothetical protein
MNTQAPLTVLVDVASDVVEAHIRDQRADALLVFAPLNEAQRTGLVTDAWSIGLRALTNAYKQAEESRLSDIGKTLKEDLDKQLTSYVERQQTSLVQSLARYFDPKDGQVIARLDGFLRDEGTLAKTMERFLAPEHGALAQTLARELGENSPLLSASAPPTRRASSSCSRPSSARRWRRIRSRSRTRSIPLPRAEGSRAS